MTSAREVPWAQLYVYLMTGPNPNDYCGQNMPDAPTWAPFAKGQTATMTISGFQVSGCPARSPESTRSCTPEHGSADAADLDRHRRGGSMSVSYHLVP